MLGGIHFTPNFVENGMDRARKLAIIFGKMITSRRRDRKSVAAGTRDTLQSKRLLVNMLVA
jgi:hypothetical protein